MNEIRKNSFVNVDCSEERILMNELLSILFSITLENGLKIMNEIIKESAI